MILYKELIYFLPSRQELHHAYQEHRIVLNHIHAFDSKNADNLQKAFLCFRQIRHQFAQKLL